VHHFFQSRPSDLQDLGPLLYTWRGNRTLEQAGLKQELRSASTRYWYSNRNVNAVLWVQDLKLSEGVHIFNCIRWIRSEESWTGKQCPFSGLASQERPP
jgi:hypothetical protein